MKINEELFCNSKSTFMFLFAFCRKLYEVKLQSYRFTMSSLFIWKVFKEEKFHWHKNLVCIDCAIIWPKCSSSFELSFLGSSLRVWNKMALGNDRNVIINWINKRSLVYDSRTNQILKQGILTCNSFGMFVWFVLHLIHWSKWFDFVIRTINSKY